MGSYNNDLTVCMAQPPQLIHETENLSSWWAQSSLHQPLARAIELAMPAHFGRPHVGVGQQARVREALGLAHARGGHPLAHRAGWLTLPFGRQLVVVHARHVDMDIDAVEQRPRDALLVARDDGWRADTLALGVPLVAAWAGMETNCTF
jgi:hypothetical protein